MENKARPDKREQTKRNIFTRDDHGTIVLASSFTRIVIHRYRETAGLSLFLASSSFEDRPICHSARIIPQIPFSDKT